MESILTSVKSLLGLSEEFVEFDEQIMMHINSAIFTLAQIGVGPISIFKVTGKEDTFEDYLGDDLPKFPGVSTYLYYRTRLGFDPPTNSFMIEQIKNEIAELEWRMQVEKEIPLKEVVEESENEEEDDYPYIPDPILPEEPDEPDLEEGDDFQNE